MTLYLSTYHSWSETKNATRFCAVHARLWVAFRPQTVFKIVKQGDGHYHDIKVPETHWFYLGLLIAHLIMLDAIHWRLILDQVLGDFCPNKTYNKSRSATFWFSIWNYWFFRQKREKEERVEWAEERGKREASHDQNMSKLISANVYLRERRKGKDGLWHLIWLYNDYSTEAAALPHFFGCT